MAVTYAGPDAGTYSVLWNTATTDGCSGIRSPIDVKLSQAVRIPARRAQVWEFLMDIPRMASCIPGMEQFEAVTDDRLRGSLRVRVGRIGLSMRCDVLVVERHPATHTAVVPGEAADERAAGTIKATARMALAEIDGPEPVTELRIDSNATIMGRIGEFGQPIIRRKADQLLAEFAANARRAVSETR